MRYGNDRRRGNGTQRERHTLCVGAGISDTAGAAANYEEASVQPESQGSLNFGRMHALMLSRFGVISFGNDTLDSLNCKSYNWFVEKRRFRVNSM